MSEGTDVSLPGDLASIPDPLRGSSSMPPAMPPPEEPSLTRSVRRRRAQLLVAVALGWAAGIVSVLGVRPDLSTPPALIQLAIVGACLALSVWVVTRPGRVGLGPSTALVRPILLGLPLTYLVLAVVHGSAGPEPSWLTHFACLGLSSLVALGPFAALSFALRHLLLTAPALRGAALGLAAGLVGSLGIQVHCSLSQPLHATLGHGAVLVLAAALGALSARNPA